MPWTQIEAPLHVLHAPCASRFAHGSRRTTIRSTLRFPGHDLALRAPRLLQRVLAEEKLSPVRGRLVHPGHRLARRAVVLVLVLVGGGGDGLGLAAAAERRGRTSRLAPQRGLDLHRGRGAFVPRSLSFVPRSLSSFVLVPAVWERPEALGPRARRGGARRRRRRRRSARVDAVVADAVVAGHRGEVVEQPREERLIHLPVSRHLEPQRLVLLSQRLARARQDVDTCGDVVSSEATCDSRWRSRATSALDIRRWLNTPMGRGVRARDARARGPRASARCHTTRLVLGLAETKTPLGISDSQELSDERKRLPSKHPMTCRQLEPSARPAFFCTIS